MCCSNDHKLYKVCCVVRSMLHTSKTEALKQIICPLSLNSVPQGSILGPLFILLYINDLPKIITTSNSMVHFTYDTSLLITDSNDLDLNININHSFRNIISWFNNNLLILNFNKTHYMEFWMQIIIRLKLKLNMNTKIFQIPRRLNFWD